MTAHTTTDRATDTTAVATERDASEDVAALSRSKVEQSLGCVALVVRDYDEAIEFYTQKLGFELVTDERLTSEKRWVVVAPPGASGTRLLLARARGAEQASRIGNQTGGRVFLFLHTDDFARDHARMLRRGVRFLEPPRHEAYGTVAVFEDLYGNRWDLLEPSATDRPASPPAR